ncbi:MAG: sigma-70 family RNA polymerase sigma factor [Pseudomonadota bacterium]
MGRALTMVATGAGKDEQTDAALLAAVAEGDMRAFHRLHRRYHSRVHSFALRLVRRSDLADEAANDTMVTVWRQAGSFRGDARVSTWVFGIAYRTTLRALRRVARHEGHDEVDETIAAPHTGTQMVEAAFLSRDIASALEQLPVAQRATVVLTHHFGYRLSEIAAITGLPEGTVKSRMFHARSRLRELLAGAAP